MRDCPIVISVLAKRASTSSWTFLSALTISCEVIFPSAATERNSPTVIPIPLAIAFAKAGVCSITELSSSPRNVPLANACPN